MNNAESLQVSAHLLWTINVGDFRHVSIADASADMVKDTAVALSKAYPDQRVQVQTEGRIRWFFENGEEVNKKSDDFNANLCPFSTESYRHLWMTGQSFPVVTWVDQTADGRVSFL